MDVLSDTCKLNDRGILHSTYQGELSTTRNGYTCKTWDSNGLKGHNYCRNPSDNLGAWCYTTRPGNNWDYCDCNTILPENDELDFFDMIKFRNWDVHPYSLKKELDTKTGFYYFRYWYNLGGEITFNSNRGFWDYTSSMSTKKATFCSIRIKTVTLDSDIKTTTINSETTTPKPDSCSCYPIKEIP